MVRKLPPEPLNLLSLPNNRELLQLFTTAGGFNLDRLVDRFIHRNRRKEAVNKAEGIFKTVELLDQACIFGGWSRADAEGLVDWLNDVNSSADVGEWSCDDGSSYGSCGVGPLWGFNWIDPLTFVDLKAEGVVEVNLAAHLSARGPCLWLRRAVTYGVSWGESATTDDDVACVWKVTWIAHDEGES